MGDVAAVMGRCRLCLNDPIKLQDSHYLPKGIYRALRNHIPGENPNPWTFTDKASVQTSKQITAHLLCADCEQRFNRNGEDWVLRHGLRQDGSFRLAGTLEGRGPTVAKDGDATKVYFANSIPDIDVPALTYFAASMFWRGSIHPWNSDGTYPVQLGRYQEDFRRYLLGDKSLPDNAAVCVIHRQSSRGDRVTYTPVGERSGSCHSYRFAMPGLAFLLFVGQRIPLSRRQFCFWRNPYHPIISSESVDQLITMEAVAMRSRSLRGHRRPLT